MTVGALLFWCSVCDGIEGNYSWKREVEERRLDCTPEGPVLGSSYDAQWKVQVLGR